MGARSQFTKLAIVSRVLRRIFQEVLIHTGIWANTTTIICSMCFLRKCRFQSRTIIWGFPVVPTGNDGTDADGAEMETLDVPTVYPVHPWNHACAERLCREHGYRNLILTQPVGYQTSISLVNRAQKVVTDSGGVQRETFFAKKTCVTVLDFVVWPETMEGGCNQLARPDKADILRKLSAQVAFDPEYQPFGHGHSAEKIIDCIQSFFG